MTKLIIFLCLFSNTSAFARPEIDLVETVSALCELVAPKGSSDFYHCLGSALVGETIPRSWESKIKDADKVYPAKSK